MDRLKDLRAGYNYYLMQDMPGAQQWFEKEIAAQLAANDLDRYEARRVLLGRLDQEYENNRKRVFLDSGVDFLTDLNLQTYEGLTPEAEPRVLELGFANGSSAQFQISYEADDQEEGDGVDNSVDVLGIIDIPEDMPDWAINFLRKFVHLPSFHLVDQATGERDLKLESELVFSYAKRKIAMWREAMELAGLVENTSGGCEINRNVFEAGKQIGDKYLARVEYEPELFHHNGAAEIMRSLQAFVYLLPYTGFGRTVPRIDREKTMLLRSALAFRRANWPDTQINTSVAIKPFDSIDDKIQVADPLKIIDYNTAKQHGFKSYRQMDEEIFGYNGIAKLINNNPIDAVRAVYLMLAKNTPVPLKIEDSSGMRLLEEEARMVKFNLDRDDERNSQIDDFVEGFKQ